MRSCRSESSHQPEPGIRTERRSSTYSSDNSVRAETFRSSATGTGTGTEEIISAFIVRQMASGGCIGRHGDSAIWSDRRPADTKRVRAVGFLPIPWDGRFATEAIGPYVFCGMSSPSGKNSSDAELRQYRCPVGGGPSGKTWPWCPPQRAQRISMRRIP